MTTKDKERYLAMIDRTIEKYRAAEWVWKPGGVDWVLMIGDYEVAANCELCNDAGDCHKCVIFELFSDTCHGAIDSAFDSKNKRPIMDGLRKLRRKVEDA